MTNDKCKIKNTNPSNKFMYDDIEFKSKAEIMCYKTLCQNEIKPEYEKHTINLLEEFVPTIPFLVKNHFKRNLKSVEKHSTFAIDNRIVDAWTYTPDFYFQYKNWKVYIEVKGWANDVWPYKCKMFRWYLESLKDKKDYEFWEIHTRKQLLECIEHLKTKQ